MTVGGRRTTRVATEATQRKEKQQWLAIQLQKPLRQGNVRRQGGMDGEREAILQCMPSANNWCGVEQQPQTSPPRLKRRIPVIVVSAQVDCSQRTEDPKETIGQELGNIDQDVQTGQSGQIFEE